MKSKELPLQKEWEEVKKLWERGRELYKEGDRIRHTAYSNEDWDRWEQGTAMCQRADVLYEKADKIWDKAVESAYDKNVVVRYHTWHPDNIPTCTVGKDIYT